METFGYYHFKYWIYNLIRAFFFQNLNIYLRKTCSIVLFKVLPIWSYDFPIFLAICGFRPKITAPAWRPRMNQVNFWYSVRMRTVFHWGLSASTGTNCKIVFYASNEWHLLKKTHNVSSFTTHVRNIETME